jgi:hypothetical protein
MPISTLLKLPIDIFVYILGKIILNLSKWKIQNEESSCRIKICQHIKMQEDYEKE